MPVGRKRPVPVGNGKPVGNEWPVGCVNGSPVGKPIGSWKDVPVGLKEIELSCLDPKIAGRAAPLTDKARPVVRMIDVKCMFAVWS